jgi:hypothetical protein
MIPEYDVSTQLLSLTLSTLEHLKLMFSIWFDAELNGLMHIVIIVLVIAL